MHISNVQKHIFFVHDITEILLKVALNVTQPLSLFFVVPAVTTETATSTETETETATATATATAATATATSSSSSSTVIAIVVVLLLLLIACIIGGILCYKFKYIPGKERKAKLLEGKILMQKVSKTFGR